MQAGIQYRRIVSPIGVPAPTRVISSFSFGGSIGDPPGSGVAGALWKQRAATGLCKMYSAVPALQPMRQPARPSDVQSVPQADQCRFADGFAQGRMDVDRMREIIEQGAHR
jgi:hypothetical protein